MYPVRPLAIRAATPSSIDPLPDSHTARHLRPTSLGAPLPMSTVCRPSSRHRPALTSVRTLSLVMRFNRSSSRCTTPPWSAASAAAIAFRASRPGLSFLRFRLIALGAVGCVLGAGGSVLMKATVHWVDPFRHGRSGACGRHTRTAASVHQNVTAPRWGSVATDMRSIGRGSGCQTRAGNRVWHPFCPAERASASGPMTPGCQTRAGNRVWHPLCRASPAITGHTAYRVRIV